MIAYLKGNLLHAADNSCILLTESGVGYAVNLPAHVFNNLPAMGEQCAFYITMIVREDAQELFGFATLEEKITFETLVSISKIGARSALAILSLYRPEELHQIVLAQDAASLTRVPGIGQKTAQHVLLELRYKLRNRTINVSTQPQPGIYADVLAAMCNLGYDEADCSQSIKDIIKKEPDLDVAQAIRLTLKILAQRHK